MGTKKKSKRATSSQRNASHDFDAGGSDEDNAQQNTPSGKLKAAKGSRLTSSSRKKAQPSKVVKEKETLHAKYFASQQEDSDADADSKAYANADAKAGAKQIDESEGTY